MPTGYAEARNRVFHRIHIVAASLAMQNVSQISPTRPVAIFTRGNED
jgi:hypothetical protein